MLVGFQLQLTVISKHKSYIVVVLWDKHVSGTIDHIEPDIMPTVENKSSTEEFIPSWITITSQRKCKAEFAKLQDKVNSPLDDIVTDYGYVIRNSLTKRYAAYLESVEFLFTNLTRNLTAIEEHKNCLDYWEEFTKIDEIFVNITGFGANMSTAKTYDEAYQYAKYIPKYHRQRVALPYKEEKYESLYSEMRDSCNWMKNYGKETVKKGKKILRKFEHVLARMRVRVSELVHQQHLFEHMSRVMTDLLEPAINTAEQIFKNITTSTNNQLMASTENYVILRQKFSDGMFYFKKETGDSRDELESAYQQISMLKFPVINWNNIYKLQLVEETAALNDSEWPELTNSVGVGFGTSLSLMIREAYDRLLTPLEELTTSFVELEVDLLLHVEEFNQFFQEYKKAASMDTGFYL